jgi:uncharacterized protein (TIGR02246 family)
VSQRFRSATFLLVTIVLMAAMTLPFTVQPAKAIVKPLGNSIAKTEVMRMTPDAARSLIERAANSWIKGDAKAFAALFVPDGEFLVPGQRLVGVGAIEKVAAEFNSTHSQVHIEIQRSLVDCLQAIVEWQWEDTENGTGKRTRADDVIVIDFVDGKIKRWREYIDTETPQAR